MSHSTRFRAFEDKTPEPYKIRSSKESGDHYVTKTREYRDNYCSEVLQGSSHDPNTVPSPRNGLVDTVLHCYNHHQNLVLRPDDIWAGILTQFSFYINAHAEEFRSQFVNFKDKKELTVSIPGTLRAAPYDLFVELMTKEIDANLVDKEVKDWILPNFSTTTRDDLVTCGVILMASMKKYFDYSGCLLCGIPWVTLEGTLADWESIVTKAAKLKEYKLESWYSMLEPILAQFVATKKGKPDIGFWQRICSYNGGGSGPSYLSGWITAFCVFGRDGKWQGDKLEVYIWGHVHKDSWPFVDTDDIPTGVVEVDVKIEDNSPDNLYYSVMIAGHMAFQVLGEDQATLQPRLGWAICLKPSPEEFRLLNVEKEAREKQFGI